MIMAYSISLASLIVIIVVITIIIIIIIIIIITSTFFPALNSCLLLYITSQLPPAAQR